MIQCQAIIEIASPPAAVFAFIDDTTKAPQWLGMCHSLEVTSPPPKQAGSAIRYQYKEGGGVREMLGSVTAYDPPRRVQMTLTDSMFEIVITFRVEAANGGSRFETTFDITPLKLMAKLMAGMVRKATQKQVEKDVANLKSLLESRSR